MIHNGMKNSSSDYYDVKSQWKKIKQGVKHLKFKKILKNQLIFVILKFKK